MCMHSSIIVGQQTQTTKLKTLVMKTLVIKSGVFSANRLIRVTKNKKTYAKFKKRSKNCPQGAKTSHNMYLFLARACSIPMLTPQSERGFHSSLFYLHQHLKETEHPTTKTTDKP